MIFDPEKPKTITAEGQHSKTDYNLYEGTEVKGDVETVLVRGTVVVDDGELKVEPGFGEYLERAKFGEELGGRGPRLGRARDEDSVAEGRRRGTGGASTRHRVHRLTDTSHGYCSSGWVGVWDGTAASDVRAAGVLVRHDDELRAGALGLAAPGGGDGVERHPLDLELDLPGDRMPDEAAVVVGELVCGDGEVRVTEDGEALEAHRGRGELRGRARRLAKVTIVAHGTAAWTAAAAGGPQSGSKT